MNLCDSTTLPFDRLPPHDLSAERATLASAMLDGEIRREIMDIITKDSFFQADHSIIWDVISGLELRSAAVDALTVRAELTRRQQLDEIGGHPYLAEIIQSVPAAFHGPHYARIVREKAMLRGIISLSNRALRECYAPADHDMAEHLAQELAVAAAQLAASGDCDVVTIGDAAREVLQRKTSGEVLFIPTGMPSVDTRIGGLRFGTKTIIGGKPSMGKSQLLKQFLKDIAWKGTPTGLISIEENRGKIAENVLSNVAKIDNNRIAFGTMDEHEYAAVEKAAELIEPLQMHIVDSAYRLDRIISAAHVLATKYHCKVIGVDHLHLIDNQPQRGENKEAELSRMSAALKRTWRTLNVAGVEAAQLSRNLPNEIPKLSSLRGSGSLEADADVVILLHSEDYYRRHKPNEWDYRLQLHILKNKSGPPGVACLRYVPEYQEIREPTDTERIAWQMNAGPEEQTRGDSPW